MIHNDVNDQNVLIDDAGMDVVRSRLKPQPAPIIERTTQPTRLDEGSRCLAGT